MNSFLALRDDDIAAFTGEREAIVRERVERDLRTAELVASIVELFGPVMADTLNVMGGGDPVLDLQDDDPFGEEPPGPSDNRDIIR